MGEPTVHRARGALAELKANWSTLAGATLGAAFGAAALPFYTAGLFIVHLQAEFGWTRTDLTAVGLLGTIILAVASPIAGAVFDRVGVRLPAAVGFGALALLFFYLSRMQGSLLQYTAVTLLLGVFMIGAGPVGLTRPVNLAFDRMRGLALGITIGGIGVTAAVAPPLVGKLIAADGWRSAYATLALVVLCVAPLVLLLLSWRRPADPAIDPVGPSAVRAPPPASRRLFWRLIAAFTLVALGVSGFVTHLVPMLTDGGMPPSQAAGIAGMLGLAVLVGRVAVGWLVDRIFAPFVAASVMSITALGFVLLAVGGVDFAMPGALAIGLAMGAEVDLIGYLTARYYGMARYGRLYGLFYGAFVIGTGTSPFLIAVVQANAKSYTPALWMSAAFVTGAALLFATAPRFVTAENLEETRPGGGTPGTQP